MNDQLREYTLKIVTLGQEALRVRRDGDWLPDNLAALADELLALEAAFGAPVEANAPAGQPVGEAYMATEMPLEAPYPSIPAAEEASIEDVNIEEDDIDEWPTRPYGAPAAPLAEAEPLTDSAIQVLDVDEEPADEVLVEAIVVDDAAIEDAPAPEPVVEAAADDATAWLDEWPAATVEELAPQPEPELSTAAPVAVDEWPAAPIEEETPLPEPEAPSSAPAASDEPRFCINCGEKLRPGKRFCHRCGTPVSEMFPGSASEKPAPAVVSAAAPAPFLFASPPPPVERPAELTRFCNNCGLGVAVGVTVCPDCGSRDIS